MTHATNNKLGLHLLDEYNDRPISYSNTTSIRLCLLFLTLMIMWFESWIADKMMCFVQLSFHYDSLCCRPTLDSGFFVYLSSSLSVFLFICSSVSPCLYLSILCLDTTDLWHKAVTL